MRLPTLLTKPVALATGLAAAGAVAVALNAGTASPAAACTTPRPSNRPISADAPYDSPLSNSYSARLPAIAPARGTDYGHLPRWKHFADGRVLLREDRVTLRRLPSYGGFRTYPYTNTNPLIRSYWLDRDVVIKVYGDQYYRMTDRPAAHWDRLSRVSRQQFLDSFNVHGNRFDHYLKYHAVYRLTFDATHTHIRRIEEMPQFYSC